MPLKSVTLFVLKVLTLLEPRCSRVQFFISVCENDVYRTLEPYSHYVLCDMQKRNLSEARSRQEM